MCEASLRATSFDLASCWLAYGCDPTPTPAKGWLPITVLAELGVVGFLLYLGLLASAAVLLQRVIRRDRLLGICLAVIFLVLLLHSFVYSGFFEDPLTWGVLAFAAAFLAMPGRATGGSDAATGS